MEQKRLITFHERALYVSEAADLRLATGTQSYGPLSPFNKESGL
jgi:hypothetical protein